MLLGIYLNDHLAGATIGRELARRTAVSNRAWVYGEFLSHLADEVEANRLALLKAMRALGVGVDRLKVAAGWAAEKAGRLKLNGRLLGYSPLSRVLELEALALGLQGQLAMWRTLLELAAGEHRLDVSELEALIVRVQAQLEGVEDQRRLAAAEAFA
jgi:hypothetical protein